MHTVILIIQTYAYRYSSYPNLHFKTECAGDPDNFALWSQQRIYIYMWNPKGKVQAVYKKIVLMVVLCFIKTKQTLTRGCAHT